LVERLVYTEKSRPFGHLDFEIYLDSQLIDIDGIC